MSGEPDCVLRTFVEHSSNIRTSGWVGYDDIGVCDMYASEAPTPRQPKEIWDIARSQLRLQLPRSTYETWVRDTSCLAYEDGAFVVGVANAYAKDWLSLRLRPLIKRALAGIVGQAVDITFIVQPVRLDDAPDAAPVTLLN